MTNNVAVTHRDWDSWHSRVQLCHDLMGGTRRMQNAATKWLPREVKESWRAYQNRLERSILFNGYARTIDIFTGKVFQNPILLSNGFDEDIKAWMEDIDLTGRNFAAFARDVFRRALIDGITHILVDFPRTPIGISLQEEREANIRPYMIHVPHSQVRGWFSTGHERLKHVRIWQTARFLDGFQEKEIQQILALYPGAFELYEEAEPTPAMLAANANAGSSFGLLTSGRFSLNEIPLITIYFDKRGIMDADPPLEDLAYLNLQHWRSSSDQEHILHVARVPILFGKGFDQNQNNFEIGPDRMIAVEHDGADLKYVEHTGAAISSGRQALKDIEDRMAVLGFELLIRKPSVQSATGRVIDSLESEAVIFQWVNSLQDGLQRALDMMGRWVKKTNIGEITISKDFAPSITESMELELLLRSREVGDISRERFWYELRRRGLLTENFDENQEKRLLEDEARQNLLKLQAKQELVRRDPVPQE